MTCTGVLHEDVLGPETILPVQFQRMWRGSRPVSPEATLMVSVLWQAVEDLRKYRWARRRRPQRLYMEAYRWVASDDRSWPYSFVSICDALGLSPDGLRCELLADVVEPAAKAA